MKLIFLTALTLIALAFLAGVDAGYDHAEALRPCMQLFNDQQLCEGLYEDH